MSLPASDIQYQEEHINDTKQPNLIASSVICLTAAYIAVALRLVARRSARLALAADDYVIILALFFTTAFVAMVLVDVRYGLGKHLILVTDGTSFSKGVLAAEILYNPAIFTTKLSILLLFRRIFPVRSFVIVLWVVGAFVAAYSLTAAMVNLLQCLPINALWDPTVTPTCVNLDVELIIVSSINVITDFSILCLPMPLVWRLNMTTARKLQVTGMFLLGGFVCTVSIVRATYVSRVSLTDGSWADSDSALWSVVETCIAVVSACFPTLRPLIGKPPNAISSRDRYPNSYALDNFKSSIGTKTSTTMNSSSAPREVDEENLFRRLSDG